MKPEYQKWIDEHYPTWEKALTDCHRGAEKMVEAFPELRLVAGWVGAFTDQKDFQSGGLEHHWCVTPEGEIVDPTAIQYTGRPGREEHFREKEMKLLYREWKPGDEVRVGKCMDCGSDIYRRVQELGGPRVTFCDADCEESYRKYLEREMRNDALSRRLTKWET